MAKIAELKKYLGHEFSSGSYTGEDYKSFQTKYINYLKAICRENHSFFIKHESLRHLPYIVKNDFFQDTRRDEM